jgi:hypothetical protein
MEVKTLLKERYARLSLAISVISLALIIIGLLQIFGWMGV